MNSAKCGKDGWLASNV